MTGRVTGWWQEQTPDLVGAKTITLDEDLVVLDLFADAERATITRIRMEV